MAVAENVLFLNGTTSQTVDLKKFDTLVLEYTGNNLKGFLTNKSIQGNTLTLYGSSGVQYKVKNFNDDKRIILDNGQITQDLGNLQDFYETYGDEINWFPSGSTLTSAKGTIYGDSISAADTNFGEKKIVTIDGGAGDDSIIGSNYNDKLIGGEGDDTIFGGTGSDSINAGAGDNVLDCRTSDIGGNVVTLAKGGSLSIENIGAAEVSYSRDTKNKNDLVISLSADSVYGGAEGSVVIKNYISKDPGLGVTIGGGRLEDEAILSVGDEHFNPGSGKASNSYTGTRLNDSIDARSYHVDSLNMKGVTIDSGAGKDTIYGSVGNDKLTCGAGECTIHGGMGNDTIIAKGDLTLSYGDGYHNSDTLVIQKDAGLVSITGAGGDVQYFRDSENKNNLAIYSESKGKITVKDFLTKDTGATLMVGDTSIISGNGGVVLEADVYDFNKDKYTGTWLNDSIDASSYQADPTGKGVTINSGAGNDSIWGSEGDDKLENGADKCSIYGSSGDDTIIARGDVTIDYTDAAYYNQDTLVLQKDTGNVSIVGAGSKTVYRRHSENKNNLEIGTGNTIAGDKGWIVVKDFLTKDTGAAIVVGSDTITSGDGGITLEADVYDFNKDKYTGTWLNDSIDASGYGSSLPSTVTKGVTVDAGEGDDTIIGSHLDDKLSGGAGMFNDVFIASAGNDTITAGDGYNVAKYEGVQFGKDTYTTLSSNTTLNITGLDSISGYSRDDKNKNDLIIESTQGVITVKDYLSEKNPYSAVEIDGANPDIVIASKPTDFVNNSGKIVSTKYTGTRLNDSIDASYINSTSKPKGVTLEGLSGNDTITGTGQADKIYGGAGNDSINGGGGDYDFIDGGAGNDIIFNQGGNYATITGGLGNDSITCDNATTNTFIFNAGDSRGDGDTISGGGYKNLVFEKGTNVSFEYTGENDEHLAVKYTNAKDNNAVNTVTIKNNDPLNTTLKTIKIGTRLYEVNSTSISGAGYDYLVGSPKANTVTLIKTDEQGYVDIIANKQSNIVQIDGNQHLYFEHNGGLDSVTSGTGTDDEYYINSFNAKTSLIINENGGDEDEIVINAKTKDLGVIFGVEKVEQNWTVSESKTLFVQKGAINAKNVVAALSGDSSNVKGVYVLDESNSNKGIEEIEFASGEEADKGSWYNAVAQQVGSWLDANNFSSTDEVLLAYEANPKLNISGLVNAYKGVDCTIV